MAFTRKFLTALGIEADKVDEIISAHTEVTDALKAERDKFKGDAEKLTSIQKELDELKAKNDGTGEEALNALQAKYDKLDKEFKEYKAGVSAKELRANKESAKKTLLKDAGIADKFIDLIMKASADDLDGIEFEEDGKTVKDADKKKEAYKSAYSDFVVKKKTQGADVPNPPASDGSGSAPSRASELFKRHSETMYGKTKEE